MSDKIFFSILTSLYAVVLIWSGIAPKAQDIWLMEVIPTVIGFIFLVLTYRRFRFSRPVYVLLLIHATILCVGGKYTYEGNPLFDYFRPLFHWQRNNYDKVGHFVQGFIPAFAIREYFLRTKIVRKIGWIPFFTICAVALITVTYELIEWWGALIFTRSADAFLGTQGYVWDTQSDMLLALIGGMITCFVFYRLHDRWIEREAGRVPTG